MSKFKWKYSLKYCDRISFSTEIESEQYMKHIKLCSNVYLVYEANKQASILGYRA